MENIEEIAAVAGISALFFGPGDFMIDAGIDLKSISSPTPDARFLDAMGKFGAAAKKHNLPIFGGCQKIEQIPMLIQNGSRAIAVQFDLWGFTRLIDSSLKSGWDYAKEFEGNPSGSVKSDQEKSQE
jgi:4-hydroxy-2-oxoheptanedioate aldolase